MDAADTLGSGLRMEKWRPINACTRIVRFPPPGETIMRDNGVADNGGGSGGGGGGAREGL